MSEKDCSHKGYGTYAGILFDSFSNYKYWNVSAPYDAGYCKSEYCTLVDLAKFARRGLSQKLIKRSGVDIILIAMRVLFVSLLLLVMVVCLTPALSVRVRAQPRTIYVPIDFSSIQDAVNSATEGDTVFVYNGTYVENIVVNKTVSLVGEDKAMTFIDGGGVGAAVKVTSDNVSISGFTVMGGSYSTVGAAILLYKVRYVTISDNVVVSSYAGVSLVNSSLNNVQNSLVSNCNIAVSLNFSNGNVLQGNALMNATEVGVYMSGSSNNTIQGNSVIGGGVQGIYLLRSPQNKVLGNIVTGCSSGVALEYSGDTALAINNMSSNKFNLGVRGASLADFTQNINTSNKVDGKSVYYLVNKNDVLLTAPLSQDVGYLAVVGCSNVTAKGLNLSGNGEGFLCAYSSDFLIENSTMTNNTRAAFVFYSPRCRILNNSFIDNIEGVSIVSCVNSSMRNSSVLGGNGYGLKLESSDNSALGENSFGHIAGGAVSIYSSSNCNVSKNALVANGFGILVQVSNGVRIISNVVVNNTGDGVFFSSSNDCLAQNNDVSFNGGSGITVQFAQFGTVAGNFVANNTRSGISLYICDQGYVASNVVQYNEAGIHLQSCFRSKVEGNEAVGNAHEGIRLSSSPNSTVSMNTILSNGWEGMALQYSGNSTLDKNVVNGSAQFGICLQYSPNVDVLNSNVSSNTWDGIYLRGSDHSRILNSIMDANGGAGCRLLSTNLVTIAQNNMTGNYEGLRILLANNNTISDNKIMKNLEYGINVFNSTGNRVYHNNLVNNTKNVNVLDNSSNIWDDGYPSGGNYWSDYTGLDMYWGPNQDQFGSDGIGDISYIIGFGNKDRYPLMTQARFHDLAIETVALPSKEVYPGWIFTVNVTMRNNGGYIESLNVTANCNGTTIDAKFVSNLTVGGSFTASLTWNISKLTQFGPYVVKAEISIVPGETHKEDNVYDVGIVKVKMVGDVNGDKKINILDIAVIGTAFGHKVGESRYKLNYDMNLDYVIDIVDISMAAKNYSKTYR